MLQALPGKSDADLTAAFERYYAGLATVAETLQMPEEEAERVISTILTSALLLKRPTCNLDRWLLAALNDAAGRRGEQP